MTCDPGDDQEYYLERPCLIVEVLSPHTEVIDRREKLHAYRTLPSLQAYLLVSQEEPRVEVYRGVDGAWTRAVLEGADAIALECPRTTLPVSALYEGLDRV